MILISIAFEILRQLTNFILHSKRNKAIVTLCSRLITKTIHTPFRLNRRRIFMAGIGNNYSPVRHDNRLRQSTGLDLVHR